MHYHTCRKCGERWRCRRKGDCESSGPGRNYTICDECVKKLADEPGNLKAVRGGDRKRRG